MLDLIKSLETRGYIKSEKVKKAFLKVDRKDFVPERLKESAYVDMPLPIIINDKIIEGATISAPHMHAIYLEELELKENDKFLEVGFGSGILLAYAYEITKCEVYGIEANKEVFEFGKRNLEKTGYIKYCKLFLKNGLEGLEEYAPFDKIAVSFACNEFPKKLYEQLNKNGIMLVPINEAFGQKLYKIVKNKKMKKIFVCDVAFVTSIF